MTENEIYHIENWGKLKEKATNQTGSVLAIFEEKISKIIKASSVVEEIASSMPQYEGKRSAMYRRK